MSCQVFVQIGSIFRVNFYSFQKYCLPFKNSWKFSQKNCIENKNDKIGHTTVLSPAQEINAAAVSNVHAEPHEGKTVFLGIFIYPWYKEVYQIYIPVFLGILQTEPVGGICSGVDHPTISSRISGWHLQCSGSPDYLKQNQWLAFAVQWITRLLQAEPVGGICSGVDHPTIANRTSGWHLQWSGSPDY